MLRHHPLRFQIANELHARPFTALSAPVRAAHIALKHPIKAAERSPQDDLDQLASFVERHGGPRPADDAPHFFHDFGRFRLKWERHTEYVSYTIFADGLGDEPFDGSAARYFPQDWLNAGPGAVIAAAQLHVERAEDIDSAKTRLKDLTAYFNPESLTGSMLGDGESVVCADFRIHEDGFSRFAIVTVGDSGPRRLGRGAQRLLEIETYRSMAMLTLPVARDVAARLTQIERQIADVTAQIASGDADSALLDRLTALSAEIGAMSTESAFRFGAAGAYAEIVDQRIAALSESRFEALQTVGEFMVRRFEPAMRTCRSAERRLQELSGRAASAADLLRTRINLSVQEQNQKLLASMDRRAALQLRLQETVEGLSVVAISYYAVSLGGYLLAPAGKAAGLDKTEILAIIALPVIAGVWYLARRVKRRLRKSDEAGEDKSG